MNNSKRIFYFDALRAFAILCVVLLHVTGHLAEMMNYNISTIYSFNAIFETFMNNFSRIGVDLFLILSGALLLGRNWDVKSFFYKRIPRIAKPFIFWSLIFSIILISISYFLPNVNFITQFGIYDLFKVFIDTLLFKAPGSVVYWFFWMMLYVYLLMPLLNKWINNTKLFKIEYLLITWLIFISIVYSINNVYLHLLSDFISPLLLVILGYYLRNTERIILNNHIISWILIILPAIVMLIYSYSIVNVKLLYVFHRYSLLVVVEAIGVFCLFKTSSFINNLPISFKNIISSIAISSYGMYLIHSQIIMVTRKIFHVSNFTIEYIILLFVGFILSWIIILILSKIPIIEDFIGVK